MKTFVSLIVALGLAAVATSSAFAATPEEPGRLREGPHEVGRHGEEVQQVTS